MRWRSEKYQVYDSLDTLPIWNWQQVSGKNDFRYLLILQSYGRLPDVSKRISALLTVRYYELMMQFENINLPILEQKRKVIAAIIDLVLEIINTGRDVKKMEQASVILRAMMIMDEPDVSWLHSVDFTTAPSQRQKLSMLEVAVKRYNERKQQAKQRLDEHTGNLYEQAVNLETMLGVKIDIYTTSVNQYLAYQKAAQKKIETMQRWQKDK
jgi:hypothetical protein